MGRQAPVLLGHPWGKLVDHEPQTAPPVQAAVAVDRSRKARWRLGRSVLPLVATAIALCVVVVWQRNARHIEAERQRIRQLIEPLGPLPFSYGAYRIVIRAGKRQLQLTAADIGDSGVVVLPQE